MDLLPFRWIWQGRCVLWLGYLELGSPSQNKRCLFRSEVEILPHPDLMSLWNSLSLLEMAQLFIMFRKEIHDFIFEIKGIKVYEFIAGKCCWGKKISIFCCVVELARGSSALLLILSLTLWCECWFNIPVGDEEVCKPWTDRPGE